MRSAHRSSRCFPALLSGLVLLGSSAALGQIMRDMDDLPQRARFEWGVFPVPRMTRSAFRIPPFRGVGGPGTSLGVVRKDREQERVAIDFLMFLTSRFGNELMNRESEWPPLTLGAQPSKLMAPFMPDPRGFNTRVSLGVGSRVRQVFESKIVNFYQGDDPFAVFRDAYNAVIVDAQRGGDWAWWFEYDQRRRDIRNKERVLAQDVALELMRPGSRNPTRYRRALLLQVGRNNAMDYLWLFQAQRGLSPTEAWKSFQPVLP